MTTRTHYHPLSIWLHWLVFLFFVLDIGAIELRGVVPLGTPLRSTLFKIHFYSGQMIFVLTVIRLAVRLYAGAPELGGNNPVLRLIAKAVHALLYVLLGSMVFTGMASMMAGDREVAFLGVTLPQWIESDEDLQFALRQWHEWAGFTIVALVTLHVAAAIWHHFFLRDGLLLRMRPWRKD